MSDESSGAQGYGQEEAREPSPDLKRLDRLVGTWELSGDVGGTVTYEWMEGGFFLIQHVDLGPEAKGMEVIGHERPLGQEPSADVKSRFYSHTGDTLDYTYELEGDTLTIRFGDRGSPAYYEGMPEVEALNTVTFTEADGRTILTVLIEHASKEARDAHVRSGMEAGMREAMDLLEGVANALR